MAPVDLLASRIARAQNAARERASALRGRVQELAARLYARGAVRVVLFGSLATQATPHAGTDVDLCVEGLPEQALGEAAFELLDVAGVEVDLVRWEDASPRLKRRISEDGLEIPRVAG